MKILFISDAARNYSVGGFEPLGIMYLSTPLTQAGHQVNICGVSDREIKKHMIFFKPDIIAYSATTGAHKLLLDINRTIKKEYHIFSVFGGPHPTFFPHMIEEEGVDAICIGEGETAFLELVNKLAHRDDVTAVKNFHLKQEGVIYRNGVRHLIENLDDIPFPDRELFYTYDAARTSKMKTFIASRGCPYACTYCFNHLYNRLYPKKGKVVRFRSPDNVIEEVARVKKKYPLEFVVFHDSSFLFDAEWLKEFCAKFKREIGLPFNCNARPDHITEGMIVSLKDGGCFSLAWAAEAGNDRIRNE
ncbi:MAG: radical SAM protein, partial [bacterium]